MSGLPTLFFLLDGVSKLFKPQPVVEAMSKLGYPDSASVPIGIVLIISTILYAIPRTAILGAILLTGFLGGAIATHVRANDGLFPIVFSSVFGMMVWGGLWFREARLRSLIPLRD